MLIIVVVALIAVVVFLIIYNISIHKKIQNYRNINQKINNLSVVQEFMSTIGETSSVDDKIKKINDILIEKYEIKYSTIVVFNGAEYEVKASNVDKKHWDALRSLQDVDMFKDSIAQATPKYVTVNNDQERLPYQESEFGRAKSAIFFPLYIDNVYIGYWIIESGTPHDFDNVDITVLEVIKDNIVSVLKTVVHQKTLESIVREDQFSGLPSEEYLYGEGKKVIDQYTTSTICMFKIINLEQINHKYCRELGNKVIMQISDYIKGNISDEYIFVRYMGPKFVIAFSGVEINGVVEFLNDLKEKVETTKISLDDEEAPFTQETPGQFDRQAEQSNQNKSNGQNQNGKDEEQEENEDVMSAYPKLNFTVSTYYKGTGLEEVLKKQEEYLDTCDANESDITNI